MQNSNERKNKSKKMAVVVSFKTFTQFVFEKRKRRKTEPRLQNMPFCCERIYLYLGR